jgi:protoporphyrinogen oxidase
MKKVAVIGAGFTGLASAVELVNKGFQVSIFEASDQAGGLAGGFYPPMNSSWKWKLESYYHHVFTNDADIIRLAKMVGSPVLIKKPITNSFVLNQEIQMDSPISLLRFSGISLFSRLRMGVGLALLKMIPNGLFLERYRVMDSLPLLLGKEGYQVVWEKLLRAKFGPYIDQVNLAWFWGRVSKRTKNLGYFEGGFAGLVEKIVEYIEKKGGRVVLGTEIATVRSTEIRNDEDGGTRDDPADSFAVRRAGGGVLVDGERFDAVVLTTPAESINKIVEGVDFPRLDYLWGQTLILETSQKLLQGYWLNILEDDWPFLVMVDQANFIDKKYYGGSHLVYLGNYLPEGHKQLKMSKEELLSLYDPFIKKVNKYFSKKKIKNLFLFRSPYAQPVFPVNYAQKNPEMRSPVEGVYLANMSMVYPYDRGTNYAVKMGVEVARMIINDLNNK